MAYDEQEERVTIAVLEERVRSVTQRLEAAEKKIWAAILGVLGVTVTIASEILKAGIQ